MEDLRGAAAYRGGEVVSGEMKGAYAKLQWRCGLGHTFWASPYTVLRGGHWCPHCCQPAPWDFDRLSRHSPFFAQVWYDSHRRDEDLIYGLDGYRPVLLRPDEEEP